MKAILVLAALSLIIREAAAQATNGAPTNASGTNGVALRLIGRLENLRVSEFKATNGTKSPIFNSPANWAEAHSWLASPPGGTYTRRNILIWYGGWWSEMDTGGIPLKEWRVSLRDPAGWALRGFPVTSARGWSSGGGGNGSGTNAPPNGPGTNAPPNGPGRNAPGGF